MWVRELVNPVAQLFGQYTAYQLEPPEYVGDWTTSTPEGELRTHGYESAPTLLKVPLEAAKWRWDDRGETPKVALRKVDTSAPRYQWHVHIFGSWRGVDADETPTWAVASHYELRPDVRRLRGETVGEMKARLHDHYRANEYERGSCCDDVSALLDSA